ncbi:MAG: 6-pyruvoyl tetrahydropterin synthase family protein [Planctomycetes bacterium]|nr:6-pyruvoyl tetrahydropterin synthase family protein [Planctomycetota bacterium]
MASEFRVRLEKDYLIFSAAHFITFAGDICERLHGHNYRVYAEVSGPLDENYYVVDFIALRDTLKSLVDELDHRMLLPTLHKSIRVSATENEVEARFQDRRWLFPAGDCRLLPLENTTAELLARYLGERLEKVLTIPTAAGYGLEVGVDENAGQWGIWRRGATSTGRADS